METFAGFGVDSVSIAHSEGAAATDRDTSSVVPSVGKTNPLYTRAGHKETTNGDNAVTGAGFFSLSCATCATSPRHLGMRFVCALINPPQPHRRSDDGLPGLKPMHSLMYSIRPAWPGTSPISAAFFAQASNDARVVSDTVRFFAAAAGNATPTASIAVIASVAIRMMILLGLGALPSAKMGYILFLYATGGYALNLATSSLIFCRCCDIATRPSAFAMSGFGRS
jgi:hypothetical protein